MMAGTVWLRRAALLLVLLPGLARAVGMSPDTADIIEKLTPPKPADLSGTARGIRAAAPEAPPSIDLAIPFATGSATLAPSGSSIVAALGHALVSPDLAGSHFRIEGHADTVGQPAANLALSQRRAKAVVALLSGKYRVPAGQLEAVGVGSGDLVVQTADQVDEPRNRVVRVVNLGR
jgi:outer membrane protein OmpA-like peptidoglycan-associated protein